MILVWGRTLFFICISDQWKNVFFIFWKPVVIIFVIPFDDASDTEMAHFTSKKSTKYPVIQKRNHCAIQFSFEVYHDPDYRKHLFTFVCMFVMGETRDCRLSFGRIPLRTARSQVYCLWISICSSDRFWVHLWDTATCCFPDCSEQESDTGRHGCRTDSGESKSYWHAIMTIIVQCHWNNILDRWSPMLSPTC